jgi:excinuclease UvrABC ATPase subunit
MTKKLEDLLNLPDSKEIIEQAEAQEAEQTKHEIEREETFREIAEFDKITAALPQVKGLGEMADKELNEVADKAMSAYEDLMDLGMNVESRYSGRVFEVAGGMLKTSLDAKVAKLDKKLKMVELQLKKEKMDRDSGPGDGDIVSGEGYVVTDRNSLLERLKGMDKDK